MVGEGGGGKDGATEGREGGWRKEWRSTMVREGAGGKSGAAEWWGGGLEDRVV